VPPDHVSGVGHRQEEASFSRHPDKEKPESSLRAHNQVTSDVLRIQTPRFAQ
jgi:hypothetical protein